MIVVAVGANLSADGYPSPLATCEAAVARLAEDPAIRVVARSRWYESEPVPVSDQPWYVNGVVAIETRLDSAALMACLHELEAMFGRVRRARNEARPLDLDLIDYDGRISDGSDGGPILPHPRAVDRAFVLRPLADVAPQWRDPVSGTAVSELLAGLPADGSRIRPVTGTGVGG